MRKAFFVALMLAAALSMAAKHHSKEEIRSFLCHTMAQYPRQRLADIYKSSFQNRFGPVHIVSDEQSVKRYIDAEIAETDTFCTLLYEPVGIDGNYIRVNLAVVADSIVPYATYINSFIDSARLRPNPPFADWAEEWQEIITEARDLGLGVIPDFETDATYIDNLLKEGKYASDHSDAFVKAYNPHYRIIEKDIFERRILPLLPISF